jgi:hypothetical protein
MEEDIIGDDRSHLEACREIGNFMQPQLVVLPAPQTKLHIGPITKQLGHFAQLDRADVIREVRHKNADHAVAVCDDIIPMQDAVVLAAARFAERDETSQPGIAARSLG